MNRLQQQLIEEQRDIELKIRLPGIDCETARKNPSLMNMVDICF